MYQHINEHLRGSQESEPQTWELVSKPQYCHPWALVGDLDAFSKQLTSLRRMMSLCRRSPAKTTIVIHPFLLLLPISSKSLALSENTFHSIKKKKTQKTGKATDEVNYSAPLSFWKWKRTEVKTKESL